MGICCLTVKYGSFEICPKEPFAFWQRFEKCNPFLANVPILFPLKIPENIWVDGTRNGLKLYPNDHLFLKQEIQKLHVVRPFQTVLSFF